MCARWADSRNARCRGATCASFLSDARMPATIKNSHRAPSTHKCFRAPILQSSDGERVTLIFKDNSSTHTKRTRHKFSVDSMFALLEHGYSRAAQNSPVPWCLHSNRAIQTGPLQACLSVSVHVRQPAFDSCKLEDNAAPHGYNSFHRRLLLPNGTVVCATFQDSIDLSILCAWDSEALHDS